MISIKTVFTLLVKHLKISGLVYKAVITIWFSTVLVGCVKQEKTGNENTVRAHLSVTHAARFPGSLQLYVDGEPLKFNDSISKGASTNFESLTNPYIPVLAGSHEIQIALKKDESPIIRFRQLLEPGKFYSLFILDTVSNNKMKYLLLDDEFLQPLPSGKIAFRFLNFSSNSPALDLYIVHWAKTDTIKIAASTEYPLHDFNSGYTDNLFNYISPGEYWLEAKLTGTNNTMLQGGMIIKQGSVITLFAKGLVGEPGINRLNVGKVEYIQK